MAFDIYSFIASLDSFGFFQYAIPFFISWLIIFSLFEKTKILGKNNTALNGMLSLLISLTVVTNDALIAFTSRWLSSISMGLVLLTVILLVFMFVNKSTDSWVKVVGIVLAVFAVLYALVDAQYLAGMYGGSISWWFSDIIYTLSRLGPGIIGLGVIAVGFFLVYRNAKKSNSSKS